MGGGESGGGSVVQSTNGLAALAAGGYQSAAAQAAAAQSQRAMNDAINMINRQYMDAKTAVQPYQQTGVQALDQLNQYLGLDAYNPGSAPTAPTKKTAADYLDQVTRQEINGYIAQNTMPGFYKGSNGGNYGYTSYFGGGLDGNFPNGTNSFGDSGLPTDGYVTALGENQQYNLASAMSDKSIQAAARQQVANQLANNDNATFDTRYQQYQQNLENYNQNKAWYDQYSAEGPFTQQQITDKITNLPGYQAELGQGIDAIGKQASSAGYLGSGRVLKELSSYGQNTLSKFYGNELDRLAGLAGMGQASAAGVAAGNQQQGQLGAGLYMQNGENQANSLLAGGNALAQALITSGQQYNIMGGGGGGGGMGGLGSVLGGIGSIASAFSDKNLKEKVRTPSTEEILENVKNLEIDMWKYKNIDRLHIGPYAQDVRELLGIGNGQSINLIDCVGVLFASVKALTKEIDELKRMK